MEASSPTLRVEPQTGLVDFSSIAFWQCRQDHDLIGQLPLGEVNRQSSLEFSLNLRLMSIAALPERYERDRPLLPSGIRPTDDRRLEDVGVLQDPPLERLA